MDLKHIRKLKNNTYQVRFIKHKINYDKVFKTIEEAKKMRDLKLQEIKLNIETNMNLKQIKNYEGLYSIDLNNNEVYSHLSYKYIKKNIDIGGYYIVKLHKNNKEKTIQFHRLIYEAYKSEIPEGMLIDHIDNNTQNNNIDNLRLANKSENGCNQKISKNNKLGYKNIRIKNNKYEVRITKNRKLIYREIFETLEEAIKNRDIQLKLIHKEFCNFG